ncbi:uncharacterized protein E0L32_012200 [Thyridium curvatum]|uniref:Zn(2)-C6 fungal-type domain-containing protein n=1 Tax=Thyridium curvatum TaxID=1093900 RepID=A0A507BCQ6_9PEZI|nr:uncharacterized protein E0L32_012200 [Thyridium curvatum]TPX17313.1 hypothetical protein E0L32_012200 [Thyridium curvatum]
MILNPKRYNYFIELETADDAPRAPIGDDGRSMMRKYMSKRQRPCDFCRSRKSACRIEGQPPCRLCLLHGRDCTFVEAAKPRKKPADHVGGRFECGSPAASSLIARDASSTVGGSSPVQEALAALSPSAQETASGRALLSPFQPDASLAFADTSLDFLYDLAIDGSEYQFLRRTPHSPAGSMVSAAPPPEARPLAPIVQHVKPANGGASLLDAAGSAFPEIIGLSGDMDPFLLRKYRTDTCGIFKFKQLAVHSVQHAAEYPVQFLISPASIFDHNREETGYVLAAESELRVELEQLVSVDQGNRLIRLYEMLVASQYPIFSAQASPTAESSPPHLLAAVYAMAFPFATYDDKLCIDLAYNSPPYPSLSCIMHRLMAIEAHSPSLAGVQALLLTVSRQTSNPLVSDASYRWSMVGRLVALAVNFGLNLDPTTWSISESQIAQRRRIAYIIYSTDRWLAAALGRPPHIDDANWLVTSLEPTDLVDSGLVSNQWNQLLAHSSLTAVLNTTLSQLYSVRVVQVLARDHQHIASITDGLLIQLATAAGQNQECLATSEQFHDSMMHDVTKLMHIYLHLLILRAAMRPLLRFDGPITEMGIADHEGRLRLRSGFLEPSQYIFHCFHGFPGHAISCLEASPASTIIVYDHTLLAHYYYFVSLHPSTPISGWPEAGESSKQLGWFSPQLGA